MSVRSSSFITQHRIACELALLGGLLVVAIRIPVIINAPYSAYSQQFVTPENENDQHSLVSGNEILQ